jgi:hypothetical protein
MPDDRRVLLGDNDSKVRFLDRVSGELLGTLHYSDDAFLWTTPPDAAAGAPSGWLWTDRPELVHLVECNQEGGEDRRAVVPNDQRFRDYMLAYNRQDMVMARISDPQRYKELTSRHRKVMERLERKMVQVRLALPSVTKVETVSPARPSDDP